MYMNKEDKRAIYLTVCFCALCAVLWLVSSYRNYHAKMHSIPTWGRVVTNNESVGKGHRRTRIKYIVESKEYSCLVHPMSDSHLGDSVIVFYDTTRCKQTFVPTSSPGNMDGCLFLSQKRAAPLLWEKHYQKIIEQLEVRRKEHRARQHFYDYLCNDD